jgi:hypothetical protein
MSCGIDEDVDHVEGGRRAAHIGGVGEITLLAVEALGSVAGATQMLDDRAPDRARAAGDDRRSFSHGRGQSRRADTYDKLYPQTDITHSYRSRSSDSRRDAARED